jgi:hypothetical protein
MRRVVLVLALLAAATAAGWRVPPAQAAATAASAAASGAELARADFDHDGLGDLAAGMPLEDVDKLRDAGAIAYFQGPLGGPDGAEDPPLHQDSIGAALGPGPAAGP